jgi:uroporphyrinogen-III synthase
MPIVKTGPIAEHKRRVLVTRPAAQQQSLCDALTQAGFDAIGLPMLHIVPIAANATAAQAIKNRVLALDNYQHVIFISANAVECGMTWLTTHWSKHRGRPQWPAAIRWYAIGRATAQQLASYAIDAVEGGDAMNSETLLANPQLLKVSGQRILIVRGIGGRETLAHTLRERGAQVDYCEVYERHAASYATPQLQAFFAGGERAIIANSGETLLALLAQADVEQRRDALLQTPVIVPGERVAQLAMEKGFTNVVTAKNASADATIAALRTL